MKKRGDFDSYGAFLCVKNNLLGIGKRNGNSELTLKIGFAGDFRGFYKARAGKMVGKEGDGDGDKGKCGHFL